MRQVFSKLQRFRRKSLFSISNIGPLSIGVMLFSFVMSDAYAFTVFGKKTEEALPSWVNDKYQAVPLPPTPIRHMPVDSVIRVTKDIIIPPYEDHLVLSKISDDLQICKRKQKAVIQTNVRFEESKEQRIIPAGTVIKIDEVEQEVVSDKFRDPSRFSWYKLKLQSQNLQYMTIKVSSKSWRRSWGWKKVKACGALGGFLAEDLEALSNGYFQAYKIPTPKPIGKDRGQELQYENLTPRPVLGISERIQKYQASSSMQQGRQSEQSRARRSEQNRSNSSRSDSRSNSSKKESEKKPVSGSSLWRLPFSGNKTEKDKKADRTASSEKKRKSESKSNNRSTASSSNRSTTRSSSSNRTASTSSSKPRNSGTNSSSNRSAGSGINDKSTSSSSSRSGASRTGGAASSESSTKSNTDSSRFQIFQ